MRSEHVSGAALQPIAGSLTATLNGPVQFADEAPHALVLDGERNHLSLTRDMSASALPREGICVEAWVQPDATPQWTGIVGAIQDNGDFEKGWMLGTRGDRFFFALSTVGADDGNGRLTNLLAATVFEPGHWYHVAGTYDGAVQRIYVDGHLRGESREQSGAIHYPPHGFFDIGAYHDDDEMYRFTGQISEVGVHGRALDARDVSARFVAGKADYPLVDGAPAPSTDWPTYLHDDARTGITTARLKLPLVEKWVYQPAVAPRPAWPAPAQQDFWHEKSNLRPRVVYDRAFHAACVNDRVYFGSSADDAVYCLDVETGGTRWTFHTNGPVRLAPCFADGKLYVGSDDGHVYCLDPVDGTLIWKFRAAPREHLIAGNGRLISAWPVRSGILVQDGQARFAAGLFPTQGTYQFVVDSRNGSELASGPLEFSPQGYMQRRGNQLYMSAGRAAQQFVTRLRRQGKGSGERLSEIPTRYPHAFIGAAGLRFAGGDGQIAALDAEDGEILWTAEVEGRAYGLAATERCLLVSTDTGAIHCFVPKTSQNEHRNVARTGPAVGAPSTNGKTRDTHLDGVADRLVAGSDVTKGYCVVLQCGAGELLEQLAARTDWTIVGIEADETSVVAARERLSRAGYYGRVSVRHDNSEKLPFADALIDLVVADFSQPESDIITPPEEILRVLRPGGRAVVGRLDTSSKKNESAATVVTSWIESAGPNNPWKLSSVNGLWATVERGPLEGAGQWTHMYADPANTACSGDERVSQRLALQWFGRPGPRLMVDRHHRTVPPMTAGGRLFIPGNDHVFAVNAYNGTPLWDAAVANFRRIGAMRDCGSMAATNDTLYVITEDACIGMAAQTGQRVFERRVPDDPQHQPRHWGYLAVVGDRLVGSATRPGASRSGHSKAAIEEGTYWDFRPIVTSHGLFCLDRRNGDLRWRYDEGPGTIINPSITIGGGRIYFIQSDNAATKNIVDGRATLEELLRSGAHLVALDLASGRELWKRAVDLKALEHHLFVSYAEELLVIVGSRNQDTDKLDKQGRRTEHVFYDTRAVRADDGAHVWSTAQDNQQRSGGDHGEQDHHPAIVGDTVYVEPYAYDLHTGKRNTDWFLQRGGHGCGTISASAHACFFRAGNPTMCNFATGQNSKINTVSRPGCWINILPAAGMVLIPEASAGCSCDFPLQTSMGFLALEEK